MTWLNAEFVQAFGVAVATVVGAFSAWQAKQVRQLRERVDALEAQMAEEHRRFKAAVRVIRGLLRHIEDLVVFISRRTGDPPPPNPVSIPAELEEEI
ncbi:hypothetical protein ACQPW1_00500 [Nocardia sp. CA-128927]|uniref:hypothetical protein n=1 Tax=Nocardia sp. CA-128927 TaxID=3239975 RepID=UPI003D97A9A6